MMKLSFAKKFLFLSITVATTTTTTAAVIIIITSYSCLPPPYSDCFLSSFIRYPWYVLLHGKCSGKSIPSSGVSHLLDCLSRSDAEVLKLCAARLLLKKKNYMKLNKRLHFVGCKTSKLVSYTTTHLLHIHTLTHQRTHTHTSMYRRFKIRTGNFTELCWSEGKTS